MTEPRPITVGVLRTAYRERRNFIDLPHEGVTFRRVMDPCRVLDGAMYRLFRRTPDLVRYTHLDMGGSGVDLYHHFFSIAVTRKPWVVSISSFIPRWNRASRWGLGRLAKESCKRVIAISENSADIERAELTRYPDIQAAVDPKISVLHPAQPAFVSSWDEKPLREDGLSLLFVARNFFRKGGLEMLRVVSRHLETGAPLHLTIVGVLQEGDRASAAGDAEQREARALLERHAAAITHHESLSNERVVELMRGSHVALMPTYADTYGYVVLEAQACATPVVSTNVRALPEINDSSCGWMLDVPRDGLRNALVESDAERAAFSRTLEEQLDGAISEIVAQPDELRVRGERALERIRRDHDPADRARALRAIYEAATE